jgi:hypothetical protein
MIKFIETLMLGFFLTSCVSNFSEKKSLTKEIRDSVKNVTLIAKDLRYNQSNVGGDETTVYEPSTYFNPDPLNITDQRPIWMRQPQIAHIFLIAVIASDHGFNENAIRAFSHGFEKSQYPTIIKKVREIDAENYNQICEKYGYGSFLNYPEFRKKVSVL